MTVHQATAEVFLTAFKALPRREQEDILGRMARDGRLRRVPEDISDRLAIEAEGGKPSRPLRDYIAERGRRERGGRMAYTVSRTLDTLRSLWDLACLSSPNCGKLHHSTGTELRHQRRRERANV